MNRHASLANRIGQPIGDPVPKGWTGAIPPPRTPLEGRWARVEILEAARHGRELFEAFGEDREGGIWTYMDQGPFADLRSFREAMEAHCNDEARRVHAIVDLHSGCARGVASYLRIVPNFGTIEIGWICLAPAMQRTAAATEAIYLMLKRAFEELGNRRCEWKCDSLNSRSRAAAIRFGFTFEGIFRQNVVYKGRNRDTAWYAKLDCEWPHFRSAFDQWLDPANFDGEGRQRLSLSDLMREARSSVDFPT